MISFNGANYVARQVGYQMHGWGHGDKAANEYFRPIETFEGRFEQILADIRGLGFDAMDLWTSHLNWTWMTDEHLSIARRLLGKHHLRVVSLAGWLGSTPEEFDAACSLAVAVDTKILGASTSVLAKDPAFVVRTLKQYDLKLGLENHPEKTPEEVLEHLGDGGDGTLGVTLDTGWFGTQGYDAAQAIERLDGHIFHVHLKDVLAPGAHDTCRFGLGCVPIEQCVHTLQRIGYTGDISIEHEPERFDPTEDVKASYAMLRGWMNGHS